ncbi:uncharacterized protein EAE97_004823 [Botrytis byssoidea]|uniref:Rhodopsin domain-containing protein n=1 Tax=Botrytis byssoidea TaxID=139641 RepID=A0A9P5M3J2_9HELO|nr:uncharacterized protein EAE97_004823 [Botrytis byssoidea]KAF7945785.1 hypothetical protein EAE97_004823 [Botrytis byssoidea]
MIEMSQSQIELLEGPALTPPPGVTSNFDNPYSLRPAADAVKIVTTILATLAIFIRVYTKWRIIREVHLEDYIAVAAWCGYIVFNVTTGFDPNVFGRHQWDIRLKDYQIFLYGTYITSISFGLAIMSIKISILLQYIRLFTAGTRDLMFWSCHALMWITVVFYTILLFMTIFICTPIPKFWNVLDTTGHCLDVNYLFLATGTANTITDFLIILLPQPIIWKLQMSFKEHVGVSAVFSTGLLACIASMARLFVSLKLLKNPDATWYTSIMCIPSYVELGAGIITSCLPTLPKFFKTMSQIPRVSRMCSFVSSLSKSSNSSVESKQSKERSGNSSWNQHRRMPSRSRRERRSSESYDVLEEWEGHNADFSTVSLGNTATATGMRNEGGNSQMKCVDEVRGILRSVQISVVRQDPLSGEGRDTPIV